MQRCTLICLAGVIGLGLMMNANQAAPQTEGKLLRHVVMFKFKEDATPSQVDEIVKAFGELPTKIKEIHSYEWGTNNSPEGLNKGLTHCFLVTFKTEMDREAYLPHAEHQAFVAKLKPILDDVAVIDYWAQ